MTDCLMFVKYKSLDVPIKVELDDAYDAINVVVLSCILPKGAGLGDVSCTVFPIWIDSHIICS